MKRFYVYRCTPEEFQAHVVIVGPKGERPGSPLRPGVLAKNLTAEQARDLAGRRPGSNWTPHP